MPIQGKTITVPEETFSLYWVSRLTVNAVNPTDEPSFTAILTPYREDNGQKVFAKGKDIVVNIPKFDTYAASHPDVASALTLVLAAIESAAKEQGLI